MATLKEQPAAFASITMTSLASLASGSWAQSLFVDNGTNLYLDALVQMKVKTGATAAGTVDFWLYASMDGGVSYSDGASGADAAFTPTSTPNLIHLGAVNTPSATTSYIGPHFSVAAAFGGTVPQRWGLAAKNTNGGILDATAGSFVIQYQGFTYQSA
jgi:hypothetical protein